PHNITAAMTAAALDAASYSRALSPPTCSRPCSPTSAPRSWCGNTSPIAPSAARDVCTAGGRTACLLNSATAASLPPVAWPSPGSASNRAAVARASDLSPVNADESSLRPQTADDRAPCQGATVSQLVLAAPPTVSATLDHGRWQSW